MIKNTIRGALALLLIAASLLFVMPTAAEAAGSGTGAAESILPTDVVQSSVTAYRASSNWDGRAISTDLECSDILDLKVTSHGGITTDGEGRLAFSNYATVSIALKTADTSMSIPGKSASIKSERSYVVNGERFGENTIVHLDTMVGYGVIIPTCEAASGERERSEELYIRYYNDKANDIRITKDGNYHFTVLMTVKEGASTKKLVLEYVIPVRTSIYLTDESGDYHVKDAGAYYAPARLDALGRPGVELRVNGIRVDDGYVIREPGKYKIDVFGNGYLCESFNYEIFTFGSDTHIYLSNVRAQIDDISYECENNFKVSWYSSHSAEMTYWRDNDHESVFTYTEGTVLTEPGHYVFTLNVPDLANKKMTFLVKLVPNDAPKLNQNTLYQNRFNNFKSKWYEVYDKENDLYYCFAMSEYVDAYDAAMTVERESSRDFGHYVLYGGKKYTDKVKLTADMASAAAANVRTVYYDPAAEGIEKYFSDKAFDGTVYLNPDYVFARVSPAETNRVWLTDEGGNVTNVDFFTEISSYDLASGRYTVTEEDLYGNRTEYTVVVDRTVPEVSADIGGTVQAVSDRAVYSARYLAIKELFDSLDGYALLSVTCGEATDYYLADECVGAIYTDAGVYTVRAYDRNGNSMSFMVSLEGERQWRVENSGGISRVTLASSEVRICAAYENGKPMQLDGDARALTFERTEDDRDVVIYTENTENGERDCLRLTLAGKDADAAPEAPDTELRGEVNRGSDSGISPTAMTVIVCIVALVALAAAAAVIIMIWRRG